MFAFLKKKEPKKSKELGLDEKKHLRCKYKNKKKCPKDCDSCCFSVKLRGDIMMRVQAYDSAAELYEEAVSMEPDYADAWLELGNASTFRGNHVRALEAYEEALDIDERFGEALYGRAVALKNLGRLEDALTAADDVLEYYDYDPCHGLKAELHRLMAAAKQREKEERKQEENNRLLMRMMRKAAERHYIGDRLPFVPEITKAADVFIPECFIRLTGKKSYTLEAVKAAAVCCFYGGAGVAGLWRNRWKDFSAEGISRGLFEPKGFACMDEYACTLLGLEFESPAGQELRRFAKEMSSVAMSSIMAQVGAVKMDDRQLEVLVRDSMRDIYVVGAGIGLARFTGEHSGAL